MADRPLRVAALRISNILGITQAEIRPGKVTLIEGANGEGKTSILESFRAVLRGGHDATLLRQGADRGEIVMVLDDGEEIAKRITPDKSTVSLSHPSYGEVKRPRGAIDQLCDAFSLNPVDFLTAKAETRLSLLLSAIPLRVSRIDLAGVLEFCSSQPNFDRHALEVLAVIGKDLYDQRTGVNRSAKDKRVLATEARKALPEDVTDPKAIDRYRDARAAQSTFLNEQNKAADAINKNADSERTRVKTIASEEIAKLQGDRDAAIERIRHEYEGQINEVHSALTTKLEQIAGKQTVDHEMLNSERQARTEELAGEVARAQAASESWSRAEVTRSHIESLEQGAAELEANSDALTAALAELESIKSDLLDKLPIKGVEIRDGDIYVDGIPFDRVNESRRVRLAIDVAMLRAGSLPILIVDGIEALDSKSLAALQEYALEREIQLVLARVTDSELNVTTLS